MTVEKTGFGAYNQTGIAIHPSQVTSVNPVLTGGNGFHASGDHGQRGAGANCYPGGLE